MSNVYNIIQADIKYFDQDKNERKKFRNLLLEEIVFTKSVFTFSRT
jgi:hypothetical protein